MDETGTLTVSVSPMDFPSPGHHLLSPSFKAVNGRVYKSGKDRFNRSSRPESEKTREAANARERQRMNCINAGFDCLRKTLPKRGTSRRLSKAETLREAIEYIRKLHGVLIEEGRQQGKGEREEEPEENNHCPSSTTPLHWTPHSAVPSFPLSAPVMNSPSFALATMSLSSPAFPNRPYQIH